MLIKIVFLLSSLLQTGLVWGKESIPLTDKTFDTVTDGFKDPWMIKFYSPKCPHCRAMKGEWADFAVNKSQINVGEVDIRENPILANRFEINHLPTILFFKDGQVYPFLNSPDSISLKHYVIDGYKLYKHYPIPKAPS